MLRGGIIVAARSGASKRRLDEQMWRHVHSQKVTRKTVFKNLTSANVMQRWVTAFVRSIFADTHAPPLALMERFLDLISGTNAITIKNARFVRNKRNLLRNSWIEVACLFMLLRRNERIKLSSMLFCFWFSWVLYRKRKKTFDAELRWKKPAQSVAVRLAFYVNSKRRQIVKF